MKIINEKPISVYELKDEIDLIKKREKELNFRAKKVEEYYTALPKLKKVSEFKKDLKSLEISRLKPESIIHIINIGPKDIDSLKALLSSKNLTLKEDDLKKILETVKKYV
jgi:DNA-directed RNA polymerase subunit F